MRMLASYLFGLTFAAFVALYAAHLFNQAAHAFAGLV